MSRISDEEKSVLDYFYEGVSDIYFSDDDMGLIILDEEWTPLYIEKSQQYGAINIYKKNIYEMEGQFDFIMLHHAFEHMDERQRILAPCP